MSEFGVCKCLYCFTTLSIFAFHTTMQCQCQSPPSPPPPPVSRLHQTVRVVMLQTDYGAHPHNQALTPDGVCTKKINLMFYQHTRLKYLQSLLTEIFLTMQKNVDTGVRTNANNYRLFLCVLSFKYTHSHTPCSKPQTRPP